MMKKKVLLMGKSGSGKTSMRSIIFANYIARDTMRLGATIDVEHSHVRFLGNLVLNLWDCIAEGTPVTLASGVSVPIESVRAGDLVLARAQTGAGVVPREVQAVLPRGEQECVELLFADGRTLVCTADHRLLTADGAWIEAAKLPLGEMRVAVSLEGVLHSPGEDATRCAAWSLDLRRSLGTVLDMTDGGRARSLAFARVLGYLLTDSTLPEGERDQGGSLFMGHQLDVASVTSDISLLTGAAPAVRSEGSVFRVRLSTELAAAFISVGVERGRRISKAVHVPALFRADACPLPLVREFLGGLFGGDGHTLSATADGFAGLGWSVSKKGSVAWQQVALLRDELVPLLERCGIPASTMRVGIRSTSDSLTSAKRKAKRDGKQPTHTIAEGTPLDADKSYEIKLFFSASAVLPFARCVGFRHCAHKQVRLSAGAAWLRNAEYIMRQRSQLALHVESIIARHPCTIPIAVQQAKRQLEEMELLHPSIASWHPSRRAELQQSGKRTGVSFASAKTDWGIGKFFTATHETPRYPELCAQATIAPEKRVVYGVHASQAEYPCFYVPVLARRTVGIRRVWDLAVPSGGGDAYDSFIVNGVVVHNCGGQEAFMENYFSSQRDHIFRNVELLIYVFDVESREVQKDLRYYRSCLEAILQNSKDAKIFCLLHKFDLVPEDQRDALFRAREHELRQISLPLKVHAFRTSIWDETLYKAWSAIVYSLIPNVRALESLLTRFAGILDADEVVLFERATFLVIAHAQTPQQQQASAAAAPAPAPASSVSTAVAAGAPRDVHRFEKISNIIKQFKLSCSKSQAQFVAMEVRTARFAAFIEHFTSNTYVLVVLADPAVASAATLVNIHNARAHFEKFVQVNRPDGAAAPPAPAES